MTMHTLNYKISHYDILKQTLKIEAIFSSVTDPALNLFKGKVKLLNFECNCKAQDAGPYIEIQVTQNPIVFSYTVQIGTPAKHGFYGMVSHDLTAFAGEQAFLFPTTLLTSSSFTPSTVIKEIEINYNLKQPICTVVPFKKAETTSVCESPKWCHAYELMKSSYIFGHLNVFEATVGSNTLHIYYEDTLKTLDEHILNNMVNLFKYYAEHFKMSHHHLSLVLLDIHPEPILGGCGSHIICASFTPENLRDWQLLAHRMFHSFMDVKLPLSDFHMPPQLWLTEGLATYYENMALNALDKSLQEKLNLNIAKEFHRLYTRYLYAKFKDPSRFSFPPMAEKQIRSAGQLEFLHYTHAPLVVKYIEDTFGMSEPHIMLRTLLNFSLCEPFSLQVFFTKILGQQVHTFARHFLFGDDTLPLWYLKTPEHFTSQELIDDLNYFEYMLYSWFILEDPDYKPAVLSLDHLEERVTLSKHAAFNFASPHIENEVKTYSLPLYYLLKTL